MQETGAQYFWRLINRGGLRVEQHLLQEPQRLSKNRLQGTEAAGEAGVRDGETGAKGGDLPRSVGTRGRTGIRQRRFVQTA